MTNYDFFFKTYDTYDKKDKCKKPFKINELSTFYHTYTKKIKVNSYDKIHIFTTPLWHMTNRFFEKKPFKINVLRLKFVIKPSYDKLAGAGDGLGPKHPVSPWNVGKFAGLGACRFQPVTVFCFSRNDEKRPFHPVNTG